MFQMFQMYAAVWHYVAFRNVDIDYINVVFIEKETEKRRKTETEFKSNEANSLFISSFICQHFDSVVCFSILHSVELTLSLLQNGNADASKIFAPRRLNTMKIISIFYLYKVCDCKNDFLCLNCSFWIKFRIK